MASTQFGKIVVASDLHYGLGRNSKTKLRILKDHVEKSIVSELSKNRESTTFVICGDLFHEMVSVRTDIYKEAKRFLVECAEFAHVILMAGNHDCYEDTTNVTSVELFEQLDNVEVIRFPEEKTIYGLKCLFLPWSDNNVDSFKYKDEAYDCVFCHPDVPKEFFTGLYLLENGRKMSASEKNRRAIDKEKLLDSGLNDVDFSDGSINNRVVSNLESVRKVITLARRNGDVFAGHIHKHSESWIMNRLFRFIGSPYQTTSEEIDTQSGFYVIDRDGTRFAEIQAPSYVRIKFSDVKKTGVDDFDFSKVRGNIIQFDGDDIISVETEARLKKRVVDECPFEITDTDYSNLVVSKEEVKDTEEYQKAFAASPKNCVGMYVENLSDDVFEGDEVSKKRIIETFSKLYDFIDKKNGALTSDGGASIKYRRLSARNFLSYETMDFDFEKYSGLTLIYGQNLDNVGATNACGKSNIIKAIVYALFGRFPKKVKKENMSRWENSTKDVEVVIELESNGVAYRIESGLKKGRDSFHRVFNADSGEELTKKQIAETRKFIESEILHCGFDMFMKTTVLTSSEIFNFYAMKKEDKDDYLNTIFGTKTLNEVREIVKIYLKENRSSYLESSRLLESKIHDMEMNKSASDRFEKDRKSNMEKIADEMKQFEVQIDELKSSGSSADSEMESIRRESDSILDEINRLNSSIKRQRSRYMSVGTSMERDNATIDITTSELSKHKDIFPRLCRDCKKIASDGYRLSEYAKRIKTAKSSIENLKDEYEGLGKSIQDTEKHRDELVKKSMALKSRIDGLKSSSSEIGRLEVLVESRKSTLDYIKNQANPNLKVVETLERDIGKIQDSVNEVMSKIRHLDFIQTKVVSQEVITNLLTSRFIQQLNDRIRYYLQRLGLNLGVEFDNDFHYEFMRGNGIHPEFNSLSGGESLRIVIATSFAFKDFLESRRNISSNIRFLDEFFEKDADNLGMNSTIAILKDFSRLMEQNVFLISNKLNEINDNVFDNILKVCIKDSRSFVEEETVMP